MSIIFKNNGNANFIRVFTIYDYRCSITGKIKNTLQSEFILTTVKFPICLSFFVSLKPIIPPRSRPATLRIATYPIRNSLKIGKATIKTNVVMYIGGTLHLIKWKYLKQVFYECLFRCFFSYNF